MRGPDKQLEEKTGKYAKHSAGGHKDKAVKQTDKEKKKNNPPPLKNSTCLLMFGHILKWGLCKINDRLTPS